MTALPEAGGSDLLLIHNPRCSKSRALHALLEERGVPFRVRTYLDDPLDVEELAELGRRLGSALRDFTRSGEAAFEASGLGDASSDAEWLAALAAAPILLQRPVLVRGGRARIGRPPESALDLLDD